MSFCLWYNRSCYASHSPCWGQAIRMRAAYHVIIADDDAAIRSLIARIVARTYDPVTISEVPDGLDALLIYQQQGADLVITNQEMPALSGLSLIERLRVLN